MIRRRPGARAAALLLAAAAVALALFALPVRPAAAAMPETWVLEDSTTFEIYQDEQMLGIEEYRLYRTNDTLIVGSALRLTGAGEQSNLPRQKNTTFLRRADSSFPLVFQVSEVGRDTMNSKAINCIFSDTTVMIYHEMRGGGKGEAIALPPGRLYILEPGIYAQVQTIAGDFVQRSQPRRKQPVLIPSARLVVDLFLTRGARERLGQGGHVVETTKVELTDKLTRLVAWVDDQGRMWKMEAPGQGLRVERAVPAVAAKPKGKAKAKKG